MSSSFFGNLSLVSLSFFSSLQFHGYVWMAGLLSVEKKDDKFKRLLTRWHVEIRLISYHSIQVFRVTKIYVVYILQLGHWDRNVLTNAHQPRNLVNLVRIIKFVYNLCFFFSNYSRIYWSLLTIHHSKKELILINHLIYFRVNYLVSKPKHYFFNTTLVRDYKLNW